MRAASPWVALFMAVFLWGCGAGGTSGDPGGPGADGWMDTADLGETDPGDGTDEGGRDPGSKDPSTTDPGADDPGGEDDGATTDVPADADASVECSPDGDTRVAGCGGLNGRATVNQVCLQGEWIDSGACFDPDQCVDDDTRVVPCQDGSNGDETQECREGRWAYLGDCQPAAPCEEDDTRTVPCGLNGNGDQGQVCQEAAWIDDGDCVDPDECVNDGGKVVVCGINDAGRQTLTCVNGQYQTTDCVVDPAGRITWPKDIRTFANRPRIYDMAAVGDRIFLEVQTGWNAREILVMAHPDGPARLVEARILHHGLGAQVGGFLPVWDGLLANFNDGLHGVEAWLLDGTGAGVRLLADLRPGRGSANPSPVQQGPVAVGERLYFFATQEDGWHLWTMDGPGTAPRHLAQAIDASEGFAMLDDIAVFPASTHAEGANLWRSDGTPEGTYALLDAVPGTNAGDGPSEPTRFGSLVFYRGENADGSFSLWQTDGTVAGTKRFGQDFVGTPVGGSPSNLTVIDGVLYYAATRDVSAGEVFRTDGTQLGTVPLTQIGGGPWTADFHRIGDHLVFSARRAGGDRQWFRLALTGANPQPTLIKELTATAEGSGFYHVTAFDGRVYFGFKDASGGMRLYVTDGTATGTGPVGDQDFMLDGEISGIFAVGDHLYVTKPVSSEESRLYRVVPGGEAVEIELPRERSSLQGEPAAVMPDGRLAFLARGDEDGLQLWFSDGTADGTVLPVAVNQKPGNLGLPLGIARFGNKVAFRASQDDTGLEPWLSGGTLQTTQLLRDCRPGTSGSSPWGFTAIGSRLYFPASGDGGEEPWSSDGTTGGTVRLADLYTGSAGSNPREFAGIAPTAPGGAWRVLFRARDDSAGFELFATDGTTAARVKDIAAGTRSSNPRNLVPVGDRVCFSAWDEAGGREPWCSDGTEAGTLRVSDVWPGSEGSEPDWLVGYVSKDGSSRLLFTATDGNGEREPWVSLGPGQPATRLADLARAGSSSPASLTVTGRVLLMSARLQGAGRELAMIDIEKGAVTPVDIRPGTTGSDPEGFVSWDDQYTVFAADDGIAGRELWVTDGTAAGTRLLADLNPGAGGSFPWVLGRDGNLLYVQAWTPAQGNELVVIDLKPR